MNKRVVLKTGC